MRKVVCVLFFVFLLLSLRETAFALELRSRYATIRYPSSEVLRSFNRKLYLGRLRYEMPDQASLSAEAELAHKVDVITRRVQQVLDMAPPRLHYTLEILPSVKAVQAAYQRIYGKKTSFIGFYSPRKNTVYMSVSKAKLRILAHEVGHVVVENYFEISPPVKIHEVLAQFTERHLGD